MFSQVLLLLLGLALVVFGAEYLVDGASAVARKAGLSEFLIGLTIVGIGTSMPELVVSLTGAIQGKADIALGNIVGSNLFNVLLILGVTALIRPIDITRINLKVDIPLNIAVTLLLILFGMHHSWFGIGSSDTLSKSEGFVFLMLFVAYLIFSFKHGKTEIENSEEEKNINIWLAIIMIIGGLAGLVIGGQFFVNSACKIAGYLGISDKVIAVTILAGGTSLPELVTCIVAATKNKNQLALGNIIGSNISNILLILGCSAVFYHKNGLGPDGLSFANITIIDLGVLLLSGLLLWASAYTGKGRRLGRAEGFVLITCELAYTILLLKFR